MTTSPAGWHLDPQVPGQQRYWDGAAWTDHIAPVAQPSQPHVVQPSQAAPEHTGVLSAKGHNGTVTFDGTFVTISRKGFLARASVGKGDKRIPVGSITSVQWKPPGAAVNGFIAFSLGGGNERQSRFGHQTAGAAHDENSVIVRRSQEATFTCSPVRA
ncbi:MAG: DUF4429 domain-containing protein [Actinomycetota bacterium]|nr:DUF4429 domain-containing protein [Actinomycetota bacterium]